VKTKIITISILAIVGLLFSTATAFAAPGMNLSFQASSGNSAGWVVGPGQGSASEAYLTVNTPGNSFAVITVHHFPASLPLVQPSFTSAQYASGTPRIFIYMSDGNYIFIFGDGTVECVVNGQAVATLPNGSPCSYTAFVAYEASTSTSVSAVYIVADTSQLVPYTAYITSFQYAGDCLIGACP
jgi:hypothetical protein